MSGIITGPGAASIARANATAAAVAKAKAAVQAQNASPGVRKSPVPAFTPTGAKSVQVGANTQAVNVAGIRNFLISKGYDLPKTNDPNVGHALAGAMNNWGLHNIPTKFASTGALVTMMQNKGWQADGYSGAQTPAAFNSGAGVHSKTGTGADANYTPGGNVKFNSGSVYDPAALTQSASATDASSTPPLNDAGYNGAKLLDANALSQALAGNEWDNQINAAQNNVGKNKVQTAQNLHDIGSWYDQLLASQKTAAARDTAITAAGQNSLTAADQAIIGSLGGSASAGASTVGAQAASDQGTLAALGASQDQYNQDIAPIMQGDRAGQLSAETARSSSRAADLAQQLAAAQTSKAGSTAQHLLDITNLNNTTRNSMADRKLTIDQANRQAAVDAMKQKFAEAQSVASTNVAAIAAGAKLQAAQNKSGNKSAFSNTSAMNLQSIAQSVYNALAANPNLTPAQAHNLVASHATSLGWNVSDPATANWVNSVYSAGYKPQGG